MLKHKKKSKKELQNIIDQLESKLLSKCHVCASQLKKLEREGYAICTYSLCKKRSNIWKDTIFHNKRLCKIKILKAIEYFMVKIPINAILYTTKFTKTALWKLLTQVSEKLVPNYYNAADQIGGENIIVQIDESKFGKRKYHIGHSVEGVWILGMVEKTEKRRIKLVMVDDRKEKTLSKLITESVEKGSTIHTDMWKGYNKLNQHFKEHNTVNHSKYFVDPVTKVDTNTIEGEWSGIKINVPYRGRTKSKIEMYLVRYMILRNFAEHPLDVLIKLIF